MRPFLVLFLLVGTTGSLSAEAPPKSSESDLARAYYQATKANDFGEANAAFQELSKRFPNDALTQLVADHWNRRLQEAGAKNWKEIRTKRIRTRDQDEFVTHVYQIADMIVPVVSNEKRGHETSKNAKVFTKIIADTIKSIAVREETLKEGTEITYHPKTLSLVVRAPGSLHQKLEELLNQMRRQQDLQITYDVKIVSVPAEIADTWALRETLKTKELKNRITQAEQSERYSLLMSPRLTTFNDQIASIGTSMTQVSFHGKVTEDRRSIRLEVMLGRDGEAKISNWIFSASETIPDGHTGVFFVRTEDAPSRQLDRRLLIENGIAVAPSTANQLFALITPRIITQEEEEELLGLPEKSVSSTEFPWAHPPVPSSPAFATFPSLPDFSWPSYESTCASMPPEYFEKHQKLDWDDWSWEPNLDAVNKNAQRVINAWDLNWPSQAIQYRKESPKSVPEVTPLPKRRR